MKEEVVQKIYRIAIFPAVAILGFIAGSAAMDFKVFPYEQMRNAWIGGRAVYSALTEYRTAYRNVATTDLWRRARSAQVGVTRYQQEKTYDGVTLFTSGHAQKAFLMAMDGRIVHEWSLPFSEIWDKTAAIRDPLPAEFVFWRKARVFPNGDLLAVYVGFGQTPWGYGLVKVDKDSKLIWKYLKNVHHDVDVAEDGNIYTLTHSILKDRVAGYGSAPFPLIDDRLAILSPGGTELKSISILQAFQNSDYRSLLDFVGNRDGKQIGDYLHTNAVEVVGSDFAGNSPLAKEGQVLLSFRTSSMLALLDVETESIVWASRGPWRQQHDPDLLDNGNILLFDNLGNVGPGGRSRSIEFDPMTLGIVWQHAGDVDEFFESPIRSAQQRLSNGNTLITESDGGRIFEVTGQGEVVWEYLNTARAGDADEFVAVLTWGQRLDAASLNFEFAAP